MLSAWLGVKGLLGAQLIQGQVVWGAWLGEQC